MSLFDILPVEIHNLISEMNPEHREKFNLIKKSLELSGSFSRLRNIRKQWENHNQTISISQEIPYTRFLDDNVPDKEELIEKLNECKCCSRHQKNRPSFINGINVSEPGAFSMLSYECDCECRHISRFLYRMKYEEDFNTDEYDNEEEWYDETDYDY